MDKKEKEYKDNLSNASMETCKEIFINDLKEFLDCFNANSKITKKLEGAIVKDVQWVDDKTLAKIKYRWEYMRRDPAYLKAYENKGSPESFGMKKMIDPDMSFEELVHYEILYDPKPYSKVTRRVAHRVGVTGAIDYKFRDGHFIYISIDLDNVNSIDALKEEIKKNIDIYWYGYRLSHNKDTEKYKDFDEILKVGDLKSDNPEMTFKEIAEEVYPGDHSLESAEKKAQRRYKQYEKLVNGGWREIKVL